MFPFRLPTSRSGVVLQWKVCISLNPLSCSPCGHLTNLRIRIPHGFSRKFQMHFYLHPEHNILWLYSIIATLS